MDDDETYPTFVGGCYQAILDLMMPVMDGQGFLESQAGDPCLDGIPVVLLTAQPSERARQFAAVRGVVPEPFDLGLIGEICKGAPHAR